MTARLTDQRKAEGRAFRDKWRETLAGLQREFPAVSCPPFTVWYRHDCEGRGSWAMYLRQQYATSADGFFAFIYRQGTCVRCHFAVRSTGRLVVAGDCPPEKGAIIHAAYELSAVRPDQERPAPAP